MTDIMDKYNLWLADISVSGIYFDLQLFSAEDEGRTEEPTEKKLREAREKGQVAKTQELAQALVVIAGVLTVFVFSGVIFESLIRMTKHYYSNFSRMHITDKSIQIDLLNILIESAKMMGPLFVIAMIAAVLGNLLQVGFQFSTHPMKFDLSKIKFDPATVMKKVFFSKQIAMNLFKTIFKVIALGFVGYLLIEKDFEMLLKTPDLSIALAFEAVSIVALKIVVWSAVLILILAIPDYFFQKQEFIESLKMTKEEVKQELKESIGDPYLKARLKEMQREILMKNMIREVPKADVVVTNPTHFAVALKYDRDTMQAPTVIAKGVDAMALRIRTVAQENGVPLVENRALAQDMYKRLEVGDIIPEDLFYAVTLIYADLFQKNKIRMAM